MDKLLLLFFCQFFIAPKIPVNEKIASDVNAETNVKPPVVPIELTWQMLFKVIFEPKWSKEYKMNLDMPVFDKSLLWINNKEVFISGFMIPVSVDKSRMVLSKNPNATCYFCGQGGPETIMAIRFKGSHKRYKTDDYVTLKGVFELNGNNPNEFIYMLNNAEEIKTRINLYENP